MVQRTDTLARSMVVESLRGNTSLQPLVMDCGWPFWCVSLGCCHIVVRSEHTRRCCTASCRGIWCNVPVAHCSGSSCLLRSCVFCSGVGLHSSLLPLSTTNFPPIGIYVCLIWFAVLSRKKVGPENVGLAEYHSAVGLKRSLMFGTKLGLQPNFDEMA